MEATLEDIKKLTPTSADLLVISCTETARPEPLATRARLLKAAIEEHLGVSPLVLFLRPGETLEQLSQEDARFVLARLAGEAA